MPNRIIKESICTSDDMAALSWFEQVFFLRLIVTADDYGRMDARPSILRGKMFPLDNTTNKAIIDALARLSTVGMVLLYEVGGRPYLQLTAWTKHQTPRAKESKYPAPDEACLHLQTSANICEQMQANAPDIRYSDSYSINDIRYSDVCAEPEKSVSTPPVVLLPLNTGEEYPVMPEQCQEWAGLYPAVDVIQQLRAMRGWLLASPDRRKTKRGVTRFINGWLAREQNRAKPKHTQGFVYDDTCGEDDSL